MTHHMPSLKIIRKYFIHQIQWAFEVNPAVALLGPRQCGKTTLAKWLANQQSAKKEVHYFDLENPVHLAKLKEPMLALEALAHTEVVTFSVKQITNRTRPVDNDQKAGFWKGGDSFPSGHASSSFAVATVFAYEYRDHVAVPIAAYTLASLISASRLSARRHWFSDIFVGGSTGFLLGRYVYKKHHDSSLPGSPVRRTDRWKPDLQVAGSGVALGWTF